MRPINYPAGTPGRGAALIEAKNGARVLVDQRHGPHLHGSARRSVRRRRARAHRLPAASPAPTPSSSTCIARRPARSRRWAISRRPRQPRGRHAHPCADRRPPHPRRRHRLHVRRRHDRRLRLGDRHGQGRAAQALPAAHPVRPLRAGRRARRRCAASRSRPTTRPAWRTRVAPVRLGGLLEEARPAFWAERTRAGTSLFPGCVRLYKAGHRRSAFALPIAH